MIRWNLSRFPLSISVAAALLAACGGSQPPVGAPGAILQSSALAARPGGTYNYEVVYSFGAPPDGSSPKASLIDVGGTLYGTTNGGGSYTCGSLGGCGTVFSLTTSGTEKVLHNFGHGADGVRPAAALIDVGGTLYGTTAYGGGSTLACTYGGCGTVFSITTSGTEEVLYSFSGVPDGIRPAAALIDVGGTLYSTTAYGGANYCVSLECGTVFSVTTSGTEKVLHSFSGEPDGANPNAPLIEIKGMIYGTTPKNGAHRHDGGTFFSITTGGTVKVLHSFTGHHGRYPTGGLTDVGGVLYGTTNIGGAYGYGVVFRITRSGREKVLHSFSGPDGAYPVSSLVDVGGTLYGTTTQGGAYERGTVFSITTGGTENVLHSFGNAQDGNDPKGGLIDMGATLYGTTEQGGTSGYGTVYALTP